MNTSHKQLNSLFTFSNFIVDPANEFAFQAARHVSRRSEKDCNPLLLFGDVGLGKTHLMQAIGHDYLAAQRVPVLYLTAQSFFDHYIGALQSRSIIDLRRRFQGLKLLLFEDIHLLQTRTRGLEELTLLMKLACECGGKVVATSDVPVAKITGVFAGLIALFEGGLSVEVRHPGPACRLEILKAIQERERGNVDDTLLTFMAKEIGSNTRTLIGAYTRVSAYQKLTGKSLTLLELMCLLQDLLPVVDSPGKSDL